MTHDSTTLRKNSLAVLYQMLDKIGAGVGTG